MPADYDYPKYKHLLPAYLASLGVDTTRGNFRCINPEHDDGSAPNQWSMALYGDRVKCFGCGKSWDIYDVYSARNGITDRGEAYRAVAQWAGDPVSDPIKWAQTTAAPEFTPDPEAIEKVYEWLKGIRGNHLAKINAFAAFRGHDKEWGRRLAWWPGLEEARGILSEETLISAGLVDPAKPAEKAAWNASGAVVRIGRGFKLHYAGRPEADGRIPTVKRGSRGCHTFPFPALPDGDTVVLVEGELDAVSGRMAGIPAVSIGGTNGMTAEDAKTLSGYRVVLAIDNDEPGRKATQKLAHYFPSCLSVDWSRPECDGEKDIDDMVKHGKSTVLLKMIEEAKEVEDGNKGIVASGTESIIECSAGIPAACGSARNEGVDNHERRHESADRGNAGNAEEGGVNDTKETERNADGHQTSFSSTGTAVKSTNNGSSDDPLPLHDEDGRLTPANIPFQFLGFDDSSYYFLPKRQNVPLRIARGQTSMKNQMTELAPMDWWMAYFSRVNDKGEETLDVVGALQWLRDGSTRKGMYNEEHLLGTGAYRDGDGCVVNTGYAIVTPSGEVSRFEDYTGRLSFTRAKVELKIDAEPWTVEDGRRFYSQLKTFGFDQPLAYYAIAGWCAIAPFASFLFRRPHIWITARRGTGKTFLIDSLIQPLIGEEYVFYTDGSTEAGIRQSLRRDNRPVILDEFEANKKYDMDSLDRILELSRSAYGGKKKVKGSSSQTAISFTLRVMFCFASINVNISNDADRSRIAVCRMTESNGRMGTIHNPDGLRARMFRRLEEINPNILALHRRMEDMEYEDRTADTYSALLVGLWMILSDARFPSTDADVAALSADDRRLYDHILAALPQTAQTEEKRPDEERILEEIFQTRLKLEGGAEKTVAELLTTIDDMKRMVYDDVVQRYGIKRDTGRDGIEYLAVVHDSKELKAMLKDTPFGSSYKEVLKRNSAYIETRQIHVAKQQMSCIVLRWKDIEERYFKEVQETDVVPF